jgi:hypothetical protein
MRSREWSWRWKYAYIQIPAVYSTGTASISVGTTTVTLTGATVLAAWVGRQFRAGYNTPILTITSAVDGASTFELDQPWYGVDAINSPYNVYQAYYPMPTGCTAIRSATDPRNQFPIATTGLTKEDLDQRDPQRTVGGAPPRAIVPIDFYNGVPRWELWPHQYTQGFIRISYVQKPADPFTVGAVIPDTIDGEVIIEKALALCARWPGASRENPNPYYSDNNAQFHSGEFQRRLAVLQREDNELMQQDVRYRGQGRYIPSAAWAQMHDVG